MIERNTTKLRKLLAAKTMLHMPAVYDALGARLVEHAGFEAVYNGGYVAGGSRAVSEPLLTMTEQITQAADAAAAVNIPMVVDAGAGFGEPLHTMRTVREFIRAGIAGVHIEDQVFPKRAHYHTYQVHEISPAEFGEKIRYACRERDRVDPEFVIIGRSDSCREFGVEIAAERVNRAADEGADLGLLFPRNMNEVERAPQLCRVPMVYVNARGTRDGRPVLSRQTLRQMGYVGIIEAQVMMLPAVDAQQKMLAELRGTGDYTGMSNDDCIRVRKDIEDRIGLEEFYLIEQETVDSRN
jgi:methylisocitrate lyase